jgi:hypothetical protein
LGEDKKKKKRKARPAQQGLNKKKGSEIALNTISKESNEQNGKRSVQRRCCGYGQNTTIEALADEMVSRQS